MEHLIPVITVSLIVAFFMYKNINKITSNVDNFSSNSFELYAKYARIVERYIKNIEEIVEKNSVLENEKYILKNREKKEEIREKLFSFIRKLAFFETLQAKQKDKQEIESQFFEILSSLDSLIKENFKNGEYLADELRKNLHREYETLKDEFLKK